MSDPSQNASEAAAEQPPLVVLGQYVKDLSFEVPAGAAVVSKQGNAQDISVSFDVAAGHLGENAFEVSLACKLKGSLEDETAFVLDLVYCGVLRINPFNESHAKTLLFLEMPQLLFPFVHSLLVNTIHEGGFPSFTLHPVHFASFFHKRIATLMEQQDAAETPPTLQ